MIYHNSLSKIFAIVLAVMVCMSCLCMTAFAAETNLPTGATLIENGGSYQGLAYNSTGAAYVVSADGVEAITITGLHSFSKIYGWNGSTWTNITSQIGSVADMVTFSPADYPDYTYFTAILGDTMADKTVTVTWTEIPKTGVIMSIVMSIVTAFFALGTTCVTWIVDTPLALFGVALFVLVFCVAGIMKLIKQ